MRILFVSQTYYPSHDAVSQILTDLAEGLVEQGLDVNILTTQVNYMTGEALPRHDTVKGVRIWRVPGVPLKRTHPAARIASYGTFFGLSGTMLALIPAPDIIVYLSTPPLVAWSAVIGRHFFNAKSVYWAQDVYPEVPIKMGYIQNKAAQFVLSKLESVISGHVDAIVAIGQKMADIFVAKGHPRTKLKVIPNWSPIPAAEKKPFSKDAALRTSRGIARAELVVQYSGNMGVVHDMKPIIAAAKELRDSKDIHWMFVGDGKRKTELENARDRHQLTNIHFFPYQPLHLLWATLQEADLSIISLRPDMEGLVLPSKLYAVLEAGNPAIFIGSETGEIAAILKQFDCGVTVQNGDDMATAVRKLHENRTRLQQMGENARRAYKEHFARNLRIADFAKLFNTLA